MINMHFQPVESTGDDAYHAQGGVDVHPAEVNDPLDDVFGGDDLGHAELSHPSDMRRLETEHATAGYREGIAVGKEDTLQEGFDEGYSMGAAIGLQAGRILGILEGITEAARRSQPIETAGQAEKTLAEAREDLGVERLFSGDYWRPTGEPGYEVDGEVLHRKDGALAHPLIRKWTDVLEQRIQLWGIDTAVLERAQPRPSEPSREEKPEHEGQATTMDPLDW